MKTKKKNTHTKTTQISNNSKKKKNGSKSERQMSTLQKREKKLRSMPMVNTHNNKQ